LLVKIQRVWEQLSFLKLLSFHCEYVIYHVIYMRKYPGTDVY